MTIAPPATGAECIRYAQEALKRCRKLARAEARKPKHARRAEGRRAQRITYQLLEAAEWATRALRTPADLDWHDTCSLRQVANGARRMTYGQPFQTAYTNVESAIERAAVKQSTGNTGRDHCAADDQGGESSPTDPEEEL